MKDLAVEYIEELKRKDESDTAQRVPISVRVHPAVMERLARIAHELGKTRAEVGADVLTHGSEDLAAALAAEMGLDQDAAKAFIYGDGEGGQ